jgi:FKBP-type peptidyl-prolyl cis-trans isomerase FklB
MSLQDKLSGHRQEQLKKVKDEGAAFLQKNKSAEGVVELPDGIQYKIEKEGTGPKPALNATILAHYAGRTLDGKEFDSSYRRGKPFEARITALIKGWQVALPMMPAGSKWRLWIPSDLAYGDNGVGQAGIPGGAVLDFDVELIEIVK